SVPPTPALYSLSLHDALPISERVAREIEVVEIDCGPLSAQRCADVGAHRFHALLHHAGHIDFEEQIGAALKVEAEIDGGFREHRSEEHTSELQSLTNLVCRLL